MSRNDVDEELDWGVPMSVDDFHRQLRRVGWKHEYIDGRQYLSPSHAVVCVRIEVEPRPSAEYPFIREPKEADVPAMEQAFAASFAGSADYFRAGEEYLSISARESISGFFCGRYGDPDSSSRIAVDEANELVIGAALVVRAKHGMEVNLLFVRPEYRRRGIATDLVNVVMNALHLAGEKVLTSGHLLANEESGNWHRRFGFEEEMDLSVTRWRWSTLRHNLQVHKDVQETDPDSLAKMASEVESLGREVHRLEQLRDRDGFRSVCAMLRRDPLED